MESQETNYDRVTTAAPAQPASGISTPSDPQAEGIQGEKSVQQTTIATSTDFEAGTTTYPRKTYLQKLSLTGDKPRPNRMLEVFIAPFKGFTYPVIVYAGLMYGGNALVWSGVVNATSGTVYSTFYNFSTTAIAAAYSGGIIGALVGAYYCGKIGRELTIRLARRNGGISEPEHTLYMFVASMILVPFSILLYGLGVTYRVHWFALVFAQSTLAVSNTLCVAGALGYAISSYHALSGELVTTCILIRNTLSFATNYG